MLTKSTELLISAKNMIYYIILPRAKKMLFPTQPNKSDGLALVLNGIPILSDNIKYLGILVDDKLPFETPCKSN